MSVTDLPPGADSPGWVPSPQEQAWSAAAAVAVEVMGSVNPAVARLVDAIAELLASDGWVGPGIRSPEHWVTWHAGISHHRAEGLVQIARRLPELPACADLFRAGRLGEDAMVRIARRVPAARDREVAELAPRLLIAQLDRLLRSLPERADGQPGRPEPERFVSIRHGRDGWSRGRFCLPADEGALVDLALTASREAEHADRTGGTPNDAHSDATGAPDAGQPAGAAGADGAGPAGTVPRVTWADALVRLATAGLEGLDPAMARTGQPADRNLLVIHHDLDPDGTLGPGQLEHTGTVLPRWMTDMLGCDTKVLAASYTNGRLAGFRPTDRRPNRALRRYLTRRDQGCTHPLCRQRRWLHAHHLHHWNTGGPTTPDNLILLCSYHHRALHRGEFTITGNPEAGTLTFTDRHGRPIRPPDTRPPPAAPDSPPPPRPPTGPSGGYTPPLAEPFPTHSFTWN